MDPLKQKRAPEHSICFGQNPLCNHHYLYLVWHDNEVDIKSYKLLVKHDCTTFNFNWRCETLKSHL